MADAPGGDGGAIDPREPHDDIDPWSSISFDDDFVKASNITELAAAERERAARKAAAKDAARRRRRERRRRAGVFVRRYTLIWATIAIVAVLAVMGARGSGPLGSFLHVRSSGGADGSAASSGPTSSTSSTSTTFVLIGADHAPGTCLVWNQDLGEGSQRQIDAVPCDQPHLFETTAQFDLEGSEQYGEDGPTDEQWDVISAFACQKDADDFLGYRLDPAGTFFPTLIKPTDKGWRAGDRHVYCGIAFHGPTPPDPENPKALYAFTGVVEGADQTRLWGNGACILSAFGTAAVVDCGTPHSVEITGTTEVAAEPGAPWPGEDGVFAAVRARCLALAEEVYGTDIPQDVHFGSYGIQESSWNIGRRTVECFFGRMGPDGEWVPVAGPLRG